MLIASAPAASVGGGVTRHIPSDKPFTFWQQELKYRTDQGPCFRDITEDVQATVRDSGLWWGQVTIFSNHTTAAIRLQEHEPLLIEDMCAMLERLAPPGADYRHNDFSVRTVNMHPDESPNGHSHCQHLMLSTSETVPLVNGALQLGEWQSIFLIELDHPRDRLVTVNILGIPGD